MQYVYLTKSRLTAYIGDITDTRGHSCFLMLTPWTAYKFVLKMHILHLGIQWLGKANLPVIHLLPLSFKSTLCCAPL